MNNVIADPAYASIAAELKGQLLKLKKQVGDDDEKYPQLMQVRKQAW